MSKKDAVKCTCGLWKDGVGPCLHCGTIIPEVEKSDMERKIRDLLFLESSVDLFMFIVNMQNELNYLRGKIEVYEKKENK